MTGQSASRKDRENEMLACDVSPDSPSGCEARGRLNDAAQWQARSMIARQGAAPKIEKKLMAMALGLLLGLPGLAKADVKFGFSKIDVVIPGVIVSGTAANANSPNAIAGEYDDGGGKTHGFIF